MFNKSKIAVFIVSFFLITPMAFGAEKTTKTVVTTTTTTTTEEAVADKKEKDEPKVETPSSGASAIWHVAAIGTMAAGFSMASNAKKDGDDSKTTTSKDDSNNKKQGANTVIAVGALWEISLLIWGGSDEVASASQQQNGVHFALKEDNPTVTYQISF
ncbi:MAG: hypothetical protein QNL04_08870 [SAR324 cluster bacterium]|nr:hypothetical protein [SAR324 cluster bacterium]